MLGNLISMSVATTNKFFEIYENRHNIIEFLVECTTFLVISTQTFLVDIRFSSYLFLKTTNKLKLNSSKTESCIDRP